MVDMGYSSTDGARRRRSFLLAEQAIPPALDLLSGSVRTMGREGPTGQARAITQYRVISVPRKPNIATSPARIGSFSPMTRPKLCLLVSKGVQ
jgi:hypothetical protein